MRKTTCECGHDRATHFSHLVDASGYLPSGEREPARFELFHGRCLGMLCNECLMYRPNEDSR